jgi:hypothetical protein
MKNDYLSRTRISILLIFLFCCENVFSQENKSAPKTPFAVSVSFCLSVPVGVFASQNTNSSKSGFAKIGGTARFAADYNLNQKWGVVFNYDRVSLPLKASTVINSFNQSFPGYTISNSSTGWWIINNYQLGIVNIHTLKNKVQKPTMLIENRCMVGIAAVSSPAIFIQSNNGGSTLLFDQYTKNTSAFSLSVGGAIKSIPSHHLFLKASLDLCTSSARFNNVAVSKNDNGVITNSTKNTTQLVSYISIGWAIGWQF